MLKSRAVFSGSLCLLAIALSVVEVTLAGEIVYYSDEPAAIVSDSSTFEGTGYTSVSNDSCCTNQDSTCCGDGDCPNECNDESCTSDCGLGCGKCCRRQCASQQESWYNCGCNGSYKFPVPPLYTYMWPGLYSQQLVTDYHSPWRFPPLKPYTNETPTGEPYESAASSWAAVRQVSAEMATHRSSGSAATSEEGRRVESTSERIRRLYQIR